MPEEVAPQEIEDTHDPEAEETVEEIDDTSAESQEDSQPAVDWEKRYRDLQSDVTPVREQNAALNRIVEAARQGDPEAIKWLGFQLDDDDDDGPDPDEPMTRAEFEAYLQDTQARQAEEAQLDQVADSMRGQLDALEKEHGKFSTEEWNTLVDLAIAHPDEQGSPDVTGAFERMEQAAQKRHERYLKSKKADRVEVGAAGIEKRNLADENERDAAMLDIMEAAEAAESA